MTDPIETAAERIMQLPPFKTWAERTGARDPAPKEATIFERSTSTYRRVRSRVERIIREALPTPPPDLEALVREIIWLPGLGGEDHRDRLRSLLTTWHARVTGPKDKVLEAVDHFIARSTVFAGGGICVHPDDFEDLRAALAHHDAALASLGETDAE